MSTKFTPTAVWRTRASPGLGLPIVMGSDTSTSGPPDLWKRMALGMWGSSLPDFRNAEIPSAKQSALTPELLEEWWRAVTHKDYNIQALIALKTMWEGASSLMPGA